MNRYNEVHPQESQFFIETGDVQADTWELTINEVKEHVDKGTIVFSLGPYTMTQMVSNGSKTWWYYIDTGADAVAVLGFKDAQKVLCMTMELGQVVMAQAIRKLRMES